jgi:hypothetical protein
MATAKQKKAAKLASENLGLDHPKTKGQILAEAGYAPSVQETPDIVFESKGFQDLLAAEFPDVDLFRVAKEGIEANKIISANITYGDADEKTNDFIEVPDHAIRFKFWERLLELKGHLNKGAAIKLPPGTSGALQVVWGNPQQS